MDINHPPTHPTWLRIICMALRHCDDRRATLCNAAFCAVRSARSEAPLMPRKVRSACCQWSWLVVMGMEWHVFYCCDNLTSKPKFLISIYIYIYINIHINIML